MPKISIGLIIQLSLSCIIILLAMFLNFVPSSLISDNLAYFYTFSFWIAVLCLFGSKQYIIDVYRFRTKYDKRLRKKLKLTVSISLLFFITPFTGSFIFSTNTLPAFITLSVGKNGNEILTATHLSSSSGYRGRGISRKYVHISEGLFPSRSFRLSRVEHNGEIISGDKILVSGTKSWAGIFPYQLRVQ